MKIVSRIVFVGTSIFGASFAWSGSQAFAAEDAGKAVSVTGKVLVRNEAEKNPQMKFLKAGDTIQAGTILNTGSNGTVKILMTDKSIIDLGPSTLFKMDDYQLKSGDDRKVSMSMDYGKMRASVNTPVGAKGKYQVRTRAATMGVRGTEFIVASDLTVVPKAPDAPAAGSPTAPGAQPGAPGAQPGAPAEGAPVSVTPLAGARANTIPQTQITVVHGLVEVKDDLKPQAPMVALKPGGQLTTVIDKPASVVQLSTAELNTVHQASIQKDVTFMQAVTIDTSNGPGTGSAALAQITENFALPQTAVPVVNNLGLPGTFAGDSNIFVRPNDNFIGRPVSLRVIFK